MLPVFAPLEVSDFIEFIHTKPYRDRDFLQQKYVVEGLSLDQIAEQIFSSKEAVISGLKRFSITLRKPSAPHGRLAQPRYGQKYRNGRITIERTEQRVIDTIISMQAQGMSLRQIAKTRSSLKMPTKFNGQAWHPQMVKQVLDYISKQQSIVALWELRTFVELSAYPNCPIVKKFYTLSGEYKKKITRC